MKNNRHTCLTKSNPIDTMLNMRLSSIDLSLRSSALLKVGFRLKDTFKETTTCMCICAGK